MRRNEQPHVDLFAPLFYVSAPIIASLQRDRDRQEEDQDADRHVHDVLWVLVENVNRLAPQHLQQQKGGLCPIDAHTWQLAA